MNLTDDLFKKPELMYGEVVKPRQHKYCYAH